MGSKIVILFAVLMFVITVNCAPSKAKVGNNAGFEVPEGTPIEKEWEMYKSYFGKKYDETEVEEHKERYIQKKKIIDEHNKKYEAGEFSFKMGINQFTDLSDEEICKLVGLCKVQQSNVRDGFEVPEGTPIDEEWEMYKSYFGKFYDESEDKTHKERYVQKKKIIDEHNKKYEAGEVSYKMGINQFTDLSDDEICELVGLCGQKKTNKDGSFEVPEGTNIDDEWIIYKTFFGKNYEETEDLAHKERYIQNKNMVDEHNKKYEAGEVTYKMGMNQFSDMTEEEIRKYLGFRD